MWTKPKLTTITNKLPLTYTNSTTRTAAVARPALAPEISSAGRSPWMASKAEGIR